MPHRILLGGGFLYLAVSNLVWIAIDTRPAFWDMAVHQSGALRILDAFAEGGIAAIAAIPFLTGSYPPLYHSIVAVFYTIFGVSPDAAQLANIPATAVLMGSVYRIGKRLMPSLGAATAAVLVAFYPLVVWLSRETVVDYWLLAMTALAGWLLLETDEFRNRNRTLLFGLACGLGMLTKWTFGLFLVLPTLWLARHRWRRAFPAAIVAAVVSATWYAWNVRTLSTLLTINTAGALAEGDPPRLGGQALLFYLRALESYQLFLPLFLVFVAGLFRLYRHFGPAWVPVILWALGGWAGLLVFLNKDPRYSVPLLPVMALVSAGWISTRRVWVVALAGFLVFQHSMISFGIPALPKEVVIAKGPDDALHRDWILYSQVYLDLWGPPADEDWKIPYVLARVTEGNQGRAVRLAIVPDIPRFDYSAFEFHILARKAAVVILPPGQFDPEVASNSDFVLAAEGSQGYPGLIPAGADRINQHLREHPDEFEVIERFALPTGNMIRLYRVRR